MKGNRQTAFLSEFKASHFVGTFPSAGRDWSQWWCNMLALCCDFVMTVSITVFCVDVQVSRDRQGRGPEDLAHFVGN